MVKAIAYIRCSTDKQDDSGLGLEAQEASIRAAASRRGLEVASVFVEADVCGAKGADHAGASRLAEDRPRLFDAINALGRGDVLLVAKRDRLARDPLVLLLVERQVAARRARVVSSAGEGTESDDPASVLMRRVLDGVAEFERAMIRARTSAAMRAKKARGESCGRAPFGMRETPDGRLEPDPREQAIVEAVRALRASGLTLRAIVAELERRNVFGRAMTPLGLSTVAGIVRRLAAGEAA